MADIFLSYKAEDRARLKPLATALEAEGFSLWWDARLEGGSEWRAEIQRELDAARCVIVAWSRRSVGSQGAFVHDEATRAKRRGVYLPIMIDRVEPPLGFGETQALPMIGWKGDSADERFTALAAAARATMEGRARAPFGPLKDGDRRVLVVGLAGSVLAAVVSVYASRMFSRPGGRTALDSIAVLPFANLSGDPAQAYFADGIAEELRAALARVTRLKVVARTSSEKMRDAAATDAARKLGVARILTGSVRRSAELIRVSAQLVNGKDGLELWSQTYDQPAGDALKVQTGIAESVAQALRLELASGEKKAVASAGGTSNPAAQEAYLKAQAALRADFDGINGLKRVLGLLDEAIRLDPGYVKAHASRSGVLYVLANSWESGAQSRATLADSRAAAERAVQLDPRSATAQAALAAAYQHYMDMAGALKRFEVAYRLSPHDDGVLSSYAMALSYSGRAREALPLIEQAIALDPLDPSDRQQKAVTLLYGRRYAEAFAETRSVLQMVPKSDFARNVGGEALIMLNRPAEAVKEFEQSTLPWDRPRGIAIAKARARDRAGSDAALAEFVKQDDGTLHYQFAQIYAQRGEVDRAFESLDRAWKAGDAGLNVLRADPLLDPLRNDPRFPPLLKRLKYG